MRHVFDTVVVGGGIFGKVISRALARQGQQVQLIDNHQANRGSDPAACLMKPGWLSKVGKELPACMQLLDELYGVKDISFKVYPTGTTTTCHWVDPDYVLYPSIDVGVHHSSGVVEGYSRLSERLAVRWRDGDEWEERESQCTTLIVAAGIWSSSLVPQLRGRIDGRWGVSLRLPGTLAQPFIDTWAPFKQIVGFEIHPGAIWVGDGSAWKDHPTNERIHVSEKRSILRLVKEQPTIVGPPKVQVGVRPYAKTNDPCLLEEVQPDVWVATGGAKNGTAAAAWAALRLIERLA